MVNKKEIELKINGKSHIVQIDPYAMLADVIREQLQMTEIKVGCQRGECGACTVLIDDQPFSACLFPAIRANGRNITTVKGLQKGSKLPPLQQAFIDEGAVQCGFCIPGMILSAKHVLDKLPRPSVEDVKKGLSGNLCRCGGYQKIFQAVKKAAMEKEI